MLGKTVKFVYEQHAVNGEIKVHELLGVVRHIDGIFFFIQPIRGFNCWNIVTEAYDPPDVSLGKILYVNYKNILEVYGS